MEYGIILGIIIIAFIIIAWALQIKTKEFKELKSLGFDKELRKEVDSYPDNETVCKEMLKMLENEDVKIKIDEEGKERTSIYMVATNTIWIANIEDTFTRIQTIAHECIHSMQNKTTLWFQFLFSCIYPIYFIVISILTILGKIQHPMIQVVLLLVMGIIFFTVRSYVEMEAMLKARNLAEKYMNTKKSVTEETKNVILSGYDIINRIGIKMSLVQLWIKPILRVVVYCTIVMIM